MFYVIDLDVRQSRKANNNASIVKRANERFCNSKILEKAQQDLNSILPNNSYSSELQ